MLCNIVVTEHWADAVQWDSDLHGTVNVHEEELRHVSGYFCPGHHAVRDLQRVGSVPGHRPVGHQGEGAEGQYAAPQNRNEEIHIAHE